MRAFHTAGILAFGFLVWAPVAVLLLPADHPLWQLDWPDGRRAQLLGETLLYAAAVAAASTLAGTASALYCWRRNGALASTARWTALLTLPFPPYLHALAWMPLLAVLPARGAGWSSAAWVQSLAMTPFAFGIVHLAVDRFDARLLDAAHVFNTEGSLLRRVLLPLLAAPLRAAFATTFLLTLVDPAAPSLFSCTPYALEIFSDFSAYHDPSRALWLSLPLVLVGLLALEPLRRGWQAIRQRPVFAQGQQHLRIAGLNAAAIFTTLPAAALCATLLSQTWRAGDFAAAVRASGTDILSSALTALAAGIAAIPLALLGSRFGGLGGWWWIAAPLALPGALTGAGLIGLWNRDWPVTPYGTFWMLPLAALARFVPLAVMVAAAWRSRLDPAWFDAAQVFGSPRRAFLRVEIPLLAPGLVVAAAVVSALALGELPATLLVVPPGGGTLALRIYNYLHYGASGSVAALSLVLASGMILAASLAGLLWRRLP